MKRFLLALIFAVAVGCNCQPADCQTTELNAELDVARAAVVSHDGEVMEAETGFHRALIVAGRNRVKSGEMKRGELIRLRVAMLSPAFRDAAEDLAVIQMAASGSDNVPLDAEGQIDRAQIDWDAIIAFLEKLIPLIIKLIGIFGGGI